MANDGEDDREPAAVPCLPEDFEAACRQGLCYLEAGNHGLAIRFLYHAAGMRPDDPDARKALMAARDAIWAARPPIASAWVGWAGWYRRPGKEWQETFRDSSQDVVRQLLDHFSKLNPGSTCVLPAGERPEPEWPPWRRRG